MAEGSKPSKLFYWAAALLVLAAFAFQALAVAQRSFWEDEAWTATLAPQSFSAIIQQEAGDSHPPLYWLAVSVWGRAFGYDEWGLKSFSLLCLLATALFTFRLGSILFGPRGGALAMVLFSGSPLALEYGHNARYYALAALLSVLVAWAMCSFAFSRRWGWLVLYSLAGIALLYTLYMGAALLVAANLWWLFYWARRDRSGWRLLGWLVAQALIGLAYLPWVAVAASAAGRNFTALPDFTALFTGAVLRTGYVSYAFSLGEFLSPANPLAWLGLAATAGLLVRALWGKRPAQAASLPATFMALVSLASIAFSLVAVYPQSAWQNLSYRMFFALPFFALWLAVGWLALRPRWRVAMALGLVCAYGAGAVNYFMGWQMIKPILATPWREVFTRIRDQSGETAVVMCGPGDFACEYYRQRYGFSAALPQEGADPQAPPPAEVWWLKVNLAADFPQQEAGGQPLAALQEQYGSPQVWPYAPQDAFVRLLKTRLLQQQDYEYRLEVLRFSAPDFMHFMRVRMAR